MSIINTSFWKDKVTKKNFIHEGKKTLCKLKEKLFIIINNNNVDKK